MQLSFISGARRRVRRAPAPLHPARLASTHVGPGRPPSRPWLRRAHALAGLVLTFNMLLVMATGLLIQHADSLGLDGRTVSRRLLPASYRPDDGPEVRADIVVTDLHSGRLFGPAGRRVVDAMTAGWFLLLFTGLLLYFLGRLRNGAARNGENGWNTKE